MTAFSLRRAAAILSTASFAALAMATASPAFAQSTDAPQASEPPASEDEVIVTARRVAENLQETPVAVTAYSGEELADRGAVKVSDLATFTPGVIARAGQSTPTALTITVRGQVQTDILATLDPSVGTYVDGVYWARAYGLNGELLDVNNAQVLRGPQGTLFGRNTSGGAFLITTNEPELDEFSASLESSVGDYGLLSGTAIANIPLIEGKLAARAAFQATSSDGYLRNVTTGEDTNATDSFTGRGRVLWEPTSNLSLLLSYEHYRTDALAGARKGLFCATASSLCAVFSGGLAGYNAFKNSAANNGIDQIGNNASTNAFAETDTVSGRVVWDTGFGELQFIAAQRSIETRALLDLDGTPFAIHETLGEQAIDQTSYELQFTGGAIDDRLKYVLGALYFEESGTDKSRTYLGPTRPAGPPFFRSQFLGEIDNDAVGVYAQGTFAITSQLNTTLGLRYTQENKGIVTHNGNLNEVTGAFTCSIPGAVAPSCAFARTDDFFGTSYTIGFDYQVTDDIMVYFKESTGFRSGGQNLRMSSVITSLPFLPEESTEDEIGVRSEFFDGRLRANLSAYDNVIENVQRSTLITFPLAGGGTGTATVLGNAAELEVKGAELEFMARLTDSLSIGGNYALTHAEYNKYADASGDRRRERIQDVPEQSYAVSAAFDHPLSFGDLAVRVDYAWTGKMPLQGFNNPADPNNGQFIDLSTRPSGGVLNARAELSFAEDRVEVAVFGRNIGDNRDLVQALILPAPLSYISGILREPTVYGVSAKVKWGG